MIDPNKPAYPTTSSLMNSGFPDVIVKETTGGMTIRAEIASRIMAGMVSDGGFFPDEAAANSIEFADALIKALNKPAES